MVTLTSLIGGYLFKVMGNVDLTRKSAVTYKLISNN